MASPLLITALAASMILPGPVETGTARGVVEVAGDCSDAAAQVVSQTGGELLSAQPKGDTCVVTVLVPGKGNARPRKVTVRVPM
ncbi:MULTISPECIES: hypothetical protein [unclassified Shinella]|jgi:hypothetical protein|uniref:hypothetical protein n=1 Tax=unclassified Shinella TaxID=2643062 RepID=UPI0003C533D1|nr:MULTISPECIES: hypothetical protein [unclassified Shinella]MCA0343459.1 hypothetical protein [Pseudomonadota bacterium]EYR81176.1 hypothetical protein SHLA_48c000130 [Shinella sp. DD12]MCO5150433.1 hypothetical protein [Shinella sp.]MDC7261380.1 hypothetical protein [Shinella sp. HY16]MDC7268275.1 hypothetical protein [Shinella sp. YZ44]